MKSLISLKRSGISYAMLSALLLLPGLSLASEASYENMEAFKTSAEYAAFVIDNLWILLAAAMVFIMHLGFATVESGFTAGKNSINVIYKNVFILCTGILTYGIIGFQLMYPGDFNGVIGLSGFGIGVDSTDPVGMFTPAYGEQMTIYSDFIFQAMFAATAATIVSGAVTGRVKISAFMVFGALLVAISYPITGSWVWGGGWLDSLGFYDFAGSTLVHGVGGAAALACVLILGPRIGKFVNGETINTPGHSVPLATVGVFLLWFGWFGFNGGSVLSADPIEVSYVFVTTAISAAAGALTAMLTARLVLKKLDAEMALNGILAGLVGITAGADVISPFLAAVVGAIAGVIVVGSIIMFDKMKIDDPVGAISVHGVCGIWGTIAVGLFSPAATLGIQLLGVLAIFGTTFFFSLTVFAAIKAVMGVRVSEDYETRGLDLSEHGVGAYPNFAMIDTSFEAAKTEAT